MRVVGLGLDLSVVYCDLAAVAAAARPVPGDFVPVACLDLVVRVFVVVAAPVAAVRPVAVAAYLDLAARVARAVVVAGRSVVVVDFVPAVELPAVVPGFGPAVYFDLVVRAVLCFGLAACFVRVFAARAVDNRAAFPFYFCLAGLVAVRRSERRYRG